ncbi:L-asparaginase [Fibrobacter sp. UWR3]|uniref:asparaginase n=1 Tax=Fibrobacter sp. UWR3 TaxID=1896217 RepID=UPI000911C173|nr:asparaginase [Fibrobacter sp. UWR3]SHM33537.1 L-asparaginase [Fibrobacter sp. UWR3]
MAKKRIVVLATGGTIAGVGEAGKDSGYVSGQISGEALVASVPELAEYADVVAEQVCNVNSDDITDKIWIALSRRIAELQEDDTVDGIVVTHGTDTMDETAYFVSLTVRCEKAVIFTGSMKPATAKNPDGPANLLGAVRVAVGFAVDDDKPANKVWVYFAGELFDARGVQKCSANALNAMGVDAPGVGAVLNAPAERNFFDISRQESLPQVNIVYFNVDANPKVLKYAACVSNGLVIAGAGSGEFSLSWAEALREIDIPVVIASRTHHGVVTLNERLAPGCICAGTLPPQKAAVLLRLALTVTHKNAVIQKFFV